MNPMVTILVPSYNHAKFIKFRIDSILQQTYHNFELIIMDDVSPDNSREIIEQYRNHPKVSQIIFNRKNSGSTFHQWNTGILKYAKGEYIWIAESDDMCDKFFLEKMVEKFILNRNLVIAYAQSARINSKNERTGSWKTWTDSMKNGELFNKSFEMSGVEFIKNFMLFKNVIPNASGVVFKKDVFIFFEGALPNLKTNGDWDIWIKILSKGDVYYCSEELNYFRYHDNSVIANSVKGSMLKHKYKEYKEQVLLKKSVQQTVKDFPELAIINKVLLLKAIFMCNSLALANFLIGTRKGV
ncbi:glycosyltransferase family 2 protein [Acinetobacter populi]|uniref:Glycosyltransferase 2-like domain-containing protein n=1 Tax=Acinetobacter populi TaxID=1582270 RepID=A0A1Z9YWT1_9GAMM|nr:glycosyltransferase family A protein [Acinetobacter populi]OUY06688.1 hypothetical protein CAP51_12215 [Acinetobacter populi]